MLTASSTTAPFARVPKGILAVAVAFASFALTCESRAATSGANGSHDPSRIVESDGKFYFCSTGGGCASSPDGLTWTSTGLRIRVPSWAGQYVSGTTQGVWAPDIIPFNDAFYIYYSFCSQGSVSERVCVVGLYTTPTLDSTSVNYKLTDAGMVVGDGGTGALFSSIDPGPIVDPGGNLWAVWGSGFGHDFAKTQLWLTRLDVTGLPLTSDGAYKPPTSPGYALQPGRKEGSYLHYRQGYYYLFYNTGGCCAGTASTYTIWVARSKSITGPFTGDKVFFESHGDIHGPGHMGIYDDCGFERFTYHYYPGDNSILGENELSWDTDGWPIAGPESTTPLKPCRSNGSGSPDAGRGDDGGSAGEDGAGDAGMAVTGSGGGETGGTTGAGIAGDAAGATGSDGHSTSGGSDDDGSDGGSSGLSTIGGTGSGRPADSGDGGAVSTSAGGAPVSSSGSAGTDQMGSDSGCTCSAVQTSTTSSGCPLALFALGISATLARRRRWSGAFAHGRKRPTARIFRGGCMRRIPRENHVASKRRGRLLS